MTSSSAHEAHPPAVADSGSASAASLARLDRTDAHSPVRRLARNAAATRELPYAALFYWVD